MVITIASVTLAFYVSPIETINNDEISWSGALSGEMIVDYQVEHVENQIELGQFSVDWGLETSNSTSEEYDYYTFRYRQVMTDALGLETGPGRTTGGLTTLSLSDSAMIRDYEIEGSGYIMDITSSFNHTWGDSLQCDFGIDLEGGQYSNTLRLNMILRVLRAQALILTISITTNWDFWDLGWKRVTCNEQLSISLDPLEF